MRPKIKKNIPLIRAVSKNQKGTGEGNAYRTSLARYIKRKRKELINKKTK